jgi:hypothetical protein
MLNKKAWEWLQFNQSYHEAVRDFYSLQSLFKSLTDDFYLGHVFEYRLNDHGAATLQSVNWQYSSELFVKAMVEEIHHALQRAIDAAKPLYPFFMLGAYAFPLDPSDSFQRIQKYPLLRDGIFYVGVEKFSATSITLKIDLRLTDEMITAQVLDYVRMARKGTGAKKIVGRGPSKGPRKHIDIIREIQRRHAAGERIKDLTIEFYDRLKSKSDKATALKEYKPNDPTLKDSNVYKLIQRYTKPQK